MIRRVLNTSNNKRNEIVAKIKRKKFGLNTRRYNIEFKIAKAEITRLNLNSCNYHTFQNSKN